MRFCPCSAALLFAAPAHSQKVGVAAAVNQNALAGGQVVNIGKSVFYNQRVTTNAIGLVQVLLVDGSTFTVGPNSNLVIDKFVYDPARGKGEMTATVSKGVLRYVGGKLSKNAGAVQVRTPHGQLGIRGGITQMEVNPGGGRFLFDFGELMQLFQRNGYTLSVYQPGNLIDLNQGPAFVRPATPEDIAFFLEALTSRPGQDGGSSGGPSEGQVVTGLGNQGAADFPLPLLALFESAEIFQFRIEDATTDRILQLIASRPDPVDTVDPVDPVDPVEPVFLTGFAAGLYTRSEDSGDGFFPVRVDLVTSEDSNGIQFTFDPSGLISGPLTVDGPEGGAVLRYGNDPNPSVITVPYDTVQNLSIVIALSGRTGSNGFCQACDFIRWGNWTGTANFNLASNPDTQQRVVVDRGFWVAGQVTPAGDLPLSGTANYVAT